MRYQISLVVLPFVLMLTLSAAARDDLVPAFHAAAERDFDQAIHLLRALPDEDRDVLFHLARVQYRDARFEDAVETLATLHKRYPDDADGYYLGGLVHLALVEEVGLFKKVATAKRALSDWETAIDKDPSHLNARYAVLAFYANAPGIAGGDLDRARGLQVEIERLDPGFGAMARGLIAGRDENYREAEAAYIEAAEHLGRAGPHFALAQLHLETGNYSAALTEIETFMNREKRWWDPDITVAHLVRAQANAGLGNVDAAVSEAETALAMNPNPRVRDLLEDTLSDLR